MKCNIGAVDKALRVAIGIVLLSLVIPVGGTAHSPFGFDTTR